ncbi:Na+/H+ antiporter subunit C [Notoacmeibacter sp. MSK16QG-6]|uniref:Na+/H+ antiporter subunit C n=1 Tax=Notoacmeibacter sp. MSK16QG-6 TaxID=2957982 RepID=UPI00209FF51E|nr:Na+/H+ antiporter subunit C [Notoacmeibacter sp. MSK16QG-6]
METVLSVVVGLLFASAVYLMLSLHTIRMLLGVVLLGNAVNLLIFTVGRFRSDVPPIIPVDSYVPTTDVANPLPQALILTAIVISFSFFVFLLVLAYRAYQDLGTDDSDKMRLAEPVEDDSPPRGY